jgi:methionyl-tRNA formyltransferase
MRLVYYGTPSLAVPPLKRLVSDGRPPDLVVTRRDRPRGRGLTTGKSPVGEAAESLGIPVSTPARAGSPEEIDHIRALAPDLIVVVAYGQILPLSLLAAARLGGLNVHYSLLPRHRGASPIQAALLAGDRETGVTTMWMSEGLDEGPTFHSRSVSIGPDENAGSLGARLAELGARCLSETLDRIERGEIRRDPQDPARATYAPKLTSDAGRLALDCPAEELARRVRAFTPEPGAFLELRAGRVIVLEAMPGEEIPSSGVSAGGAERGRHPVAGTILAVERGKGVLVALTRGSLWLARVRPSGRRDMGGYDFVNGARLRPGDRLPLAGEPA